MSSSLRHNALISALQAVATAVVVFLSFRFLLGNLPADDFGLWALLLSVAGLARLADFGVGATVARYVAADLADGAPRRAAEALQTLVGVAALLSLIFCALVWLASPWLLALVVPAAELPSARQMMPYLLANLVLTMTGSAALGGLEGVQKFGFRAVVVVGSNCVFLAACMLLTPSLGLQGVGIAQLLQGAALAGGAWFSVRPALGVRAIVPMSVSIEQLRRVGRFGASFQLIGGAQLLADLLIKSLITQRYGLPAVGLFEVAQRVALQLRAPIVAGCQAIVPVLAGSRAGREAQAALYARVCRLLLLGTIAGFGSLLVCWPLLTVILVGAYDSTLHVLAGIVALGWALNVLSAPAYFALLAAGSTRWHVAGHATTALLIAACFLLLPANAQLPAAVVAYSGSLVVGSAAVLIGLHRALRVSLRDCMPSGIGVPFAAVALLAAGVGWRPATLSLVELSGLTAAALLVLALCSLRVWATLGISALSFLSAQGESR